MRYFLNFVCIIFKTAIHIKADLPRVEVPGELGIEVILSQDYGQLLLAEQAITWTGTKLW